MEFRDYYKLLGLERSASADQIKTAYRRLARKYHPDVSKEANAEARFKQVQEAYEVLKDPQKRAAYDELGSTFQAGEPFRPPPDFGRDFEFAGRGRRAGRARGRAAAGDGSGEQDFSEFFSSLFGQGTPFSAAGARGMRDHHARVDIELEEAFAGTTRMLQLKRPQVKPDGAVELRNHTVRVTIPAGVTEGQLIRLGGQGEAAQRGTAAGDLYLEVHILPHRAYQLEGRDVTTTLAVAPWEAALGATVTAPTLGGSVEMHIPPGAQAGQKLRLRGRGLPGSPPGDEYLLLKVVLPRADTPQARALYEQMRDTLSFNPRS